ncbi:MAG: cellulase family glycosylhydrolase [Gaiellaceae bacterium]
MLNPVRLVLLALIVLLVAPAAVAQAAPRMPIGFFDDPTFRWSPERAANLQSVAVSGASIIHTTANWANIAPTKPSNPADGDDPAYRFKDLDELVYQSGFYGLRVMIDITATPKWANGGKAPNVMPTRLSDLTTFARMLATRYNGRNGHGAVALWAVWNEPNLQLFLTPQFVGKKIVGPANYAKVYKAAYAGIKGGNPFAKVAIGETSARGRDKPLAGVSASIAPGTFAKLLAKVPGLKFDAWAHHPYPTSPNLPPLQKVRYPNVTLSTLPTFEKDLKRFFHRSVPVWITEYGHETKPPDPHGVSYAKQKAYAAQALAIAKKDLNVQMFIWFVFRDSPGNPWQSGLISSNGVQKPAYDGFGALAQVTDGTTITTKAGKPPRVTMYMPYLAYYSGPGSLIGITYLVRDNATGKAVATAQPVATLQPDASITFVPVFTPVKGHTYTVTATANEPNGHTETRTSLVIIS